MRAVQERTHGTAYDNGAVHEGWPEEQHWSTKKHGSHSADVLAGTTKFRGTASQRSSIL